MSQVGTLAKWCLQHLLPRTTIQAQQHVCIGCREQHAALSAAVQSCISESVGAECLLLAVDALQTAAQQQQQTAAHAAATVAEATASQHQVAQEQVGRRLIW